MALGIADDNDTDAQTIGNCAFRDIFRGVVRALRVNIRPQLFEQGFDVRLGKKQNKIDIAQRRDQLGASLLIENRPARALQASDARIRIDGNDERVAFAFGSGQITNVTDMQRIEAAVRQYNVLAVTLKFSDGLPDKFARMNFRLGGPHGNCLGGHPRRCFPNGFQDFVARNRSRSTLHHDQAAGDIGDMCGFERSRSAC